MINSRRKGLELSVKAVVILVILLLLLGLIGMLFMAQTSRQEAKARAVRVFNEKCINYKDAGCDWSLTKQPDFLDFMAACKLLYGETNGELTCLYGFCCEQVGDTTCEGMCSICRGNKYAGIPTKDCCTQFSTKCKTGCDAC